jgi:hypothetical protein
VSSNADPSASAPFCDPHADNRRDLGLTFAAGTPSCIPYGGDAVTQLTRFASRRR